MNRSGSSTTTGTGALSASATLAKARWTGRQPTGSATISATWRAWALQPTTHTRFGPAAECRPAASGPPRRPADRATQAAERGRVSPARRQTGEHRRPAETGQHPGGSPEGGQPVWRYLGRAAAGHEQRLIDRTALLTGPRRGELSRLKVSDAFLDGVHPARSPASRPIPAGGLRTLGERYPTDGSPCCVLATWADCTRPRCGTPTPLTVAPTGRPRPSTACGGRSTACSNGLGDEVGAASVAQIHRLGCDGPEVSRHQPHHRTGVPVADEIRGCHRPPSGHLEILTKPSRGAVRWRA